MKTESLMLFLAVAPVMVQAQVYYAISGNTAYVTISQGAAGDIVITKNYNGYPVTSIGDDAFYDCSSLTAAYFQGNAPPDDGTVFSDDGGTVYYYSGTSGWSSTYGGLFTVELFPPQIASGSIGVQSGRFGFTITGTSGQTITVEASTNLVNWQPVWTNTLSGASTHFPDAHWTDSLARFYRLNLPN